MTVTVIRKKMLYINKSITRPLGKEPELVKLLLRKEV
jgi:hypothetical protein